METKDIADLFIIATGKIEFFWNFYTVTLLAITGWLVTKTNPLSLQLKILISLGYFAFAVMNILGLFGAYMFAETLRLDLLATSDACQSSLENTCQALSSHSFDVQKSMILPIHGFIGLVFFYIIWFSKFGKTKIPASSA
ncbi:hypothetical protein [Glaciecola sp. 1036]|uniref:hypothetical protein n=1 Tax=Alteromonadaceae TaxID=72275 RepID=UPI003CFE7488